MPPHAASVNSTSVAGVAPLPVHWKRPPQSPVWQCPAPAALNSHPVRPQNRPPQPLGTTTVTLCPGSTTHPVAASGCALSGVAAAQIRCPSALTRVTVRAPAGTLGVRDADGLGETALSLPTPLSATNAPPSALDISQHAEGCEAGAEGSD